MRAWRRVAALYSSSRSCYSCFSSSFSSSTSSSSSPGASPAVWAAAALQRAADVSQITALGPSVAAAVQFAGSRSDAASGARVLAVFWKRLGLFSAGMHKPFIPERQAVLQEQLKVVVEQTQRVAFSGSDLIDVTGGVLASSKSSSLVRLVQVMGDNPLLMTELQRRITAQLPFMKLTHVVEALVLFARARHVPYQLFGLRERWSRTDGDFSGIIGEATKGEHPSRASHSNLTPLEACLVVDGAIDQLTQSQLAHLLYALGVFAIPLKPPICYLLAKALAKYLPEMKHSKRISVSIWGAARIQLPTHHLHPQDVDDDDDDDDDKEKQGTTAGDVKQAGPASSSLSSEILKSVDAISQHGSKLDPRSVCSLLWGLGRLGLRPRGSTLKALFAVCHSDHVLKLLGVSQLVLLVKMQSSMQYCDPVLVDAIVAVLTKRLQLDRLDLMDVAVTIHCCACLAHVPTKLVDALDAQAASGGDSKFQEWMLHSRRPLSITSLGWGLAMMGQTDRACFQLAWKRIQRLKLSTLGADMLNQIAQIDMALKSSRESASSAAAGEGMSGSDGRQRSEARPSTRPPGRSGSGYSVGEEQNNLLLQEAADNWIKVAMATRSSLFQNEVISCLKELRYSVETEAHTNDGHYSVDALITIKEPVDRKDGAAVLKVAVEADGPSHFIQCGRTMRLSGESVFRNFQLAVRGLRVVSVPLFVFADLPSRQQKLLYLSEKVQQAINASCPFETVALNSSFSAKDIDWVFRPD